MNFSLRELFLLFVIVGLGLTCVLHGTQLYWQKRMLLDQPTLPLEDVGPNDEHHRNTAYRDANGWYWSNGEQGKTSCLSCHAGRWNNGSGRVSMMKFQWFDRSKPTQEQTECRENTEYRRLAQSPETTR